MVSKLLAQLRADGFTVTSNGLELNIAGPVEKMTPERRRQITANRDELIALVVDDMPERSVLLNRCTEATVGTDVDPSQLCQWLVEQDDPGWCVPKAVKWWSEHILRNGYPVDSVEVDHA